jgi:peptidyl-prolyl cis-trans isomerase D
MSEFTHTKTSGIIVTVLIGIIVLSFMFTGYQSFEGQTNNAVGKVGNYTITVTEYNQEYNRQIEFFKQMFGGDITAKQIEDMKLKEQTLRNIVQRKLMLKLSNEVGVFPSELAVKEEIKNLPYFKTDGQFDINRYKGLLAANKLTPQEFEQDVINQMKVKNLAELNPQFPVSKGYMADLNNFRSEKLDLDVVSFSKDSVRKHVEVSSDDLKKFLAEKTNQNRIESMYKERKNSLDKPEQVVAKHILIKAEGKSDAEAKAKIDQISKEVNAANFAKMADKYTEDPTGKGKGGSLGTFAKGSMVPEFENVAFTQKIGTVSAPVKTNFGYHIILVEKKLPATVSKLSDFQEKFAKEIIQKEKVEEIKKLTVQISNELKKAMESANDGNLKTVLTKYELNLKKADINKIDGISSGANLSVDTVKEIFGGDLTKSKVVLADDGSMINMIKTYPLKDLKDKLLDKPKQAADDSSLRNVLSKKMMEGLIKKLEKDTTVKVFSNMIQE